MAAPSGSKGSLGPYEVVAEIAKGGMGAVYEVRDPRTGVSYAAKRILKADAKALARFQREAELLARCDRHPGIVKVHAYGATPDGAPYMILDLVRGETLQQLIEREAPLPVERAARLARDIARALGAAHAQAIVHRDVKPSNVLLDRESGAARLTDFGLATARDLERLTRTGQFLGTVAYCSPEQATGGAVTTPTDVFSVGCVIFEMLTGEPPVKADTLVEHLRGLATDAPIRSVTSVRKDVPAPLAAVIAHALEKDPAHRFANGAELADDLDRFLAGEEPLAASSSSTRSRRRALARLGVGLLLALAACGAALALRGRSEDAAGAAQPVRPLTDQERVAAAELEGDVLVSVGRPRQALDAYERAMRGGLTVARRAKHAAAAELAGERALLVEDLAVLTPALATIGPVRTENTALAPLAPLLYRRALASSPGTSRDRDFDIAWRLADPPSDLVPALARVWVDTFVTVSHRGVGHEGSFSTSLTDPRYLEFRSALVRAGHGGALDPSAETNELWDALFGLTVFVELDQFSSNRSTAVHEFLAAWPEHPAFLFMAARVEDIETPEGRRAALALLLRAAERLPPMTSRREVPLLAANIARAALKVLSDHELVTEPALDEIARVVRASQDLAVKLDLENLYLGLGRASAARAVADEIARELAAGPRADLDEFGGLLELRLRLLEGRRDDAVAYARERHIEGAFANLLASFLDWPGIVALGLPLPASLRGVDDDLLAWTFRALLELGREAEAGELAKRVEKERPSVVEKLREQEAKHAAGRAERRR